MRGGVTYMPRKPHIMIESSAAVLSAATSVQAPSVALSTIFKSSTELRNDFRGKKCLVYKVGYPEEQDMPRLY